MTKLLQIAKKYIAAGFSVIPLKGKFPVIEWREFQTRQATDAELESWFQYEDLSIGIVTGKISGITVVDVDLKSNGLETLKSLPLPITWSVKTGGGGWHYYYAYAPTIGQTAGIYQGIDIRNDGGYVVAPPSVHQSGNRYEWTYKENELVEFPVHLFEREQVVKKNDWKEILAGVQSGSRNNNAASLFGKLMKMFRPEEWETVVWQMGRSWNEKNTPPLDEKELRTVFESIGKRAINDKHEPSEADVEAKITGKRAEDFKSSIIEKSKQERKFFEWGTPQTTRNFPFLEKGTYTVFFGQQGSGKTTFLINLARENSKKSRVVFLTTEMSREKIIELYCIKRAGITDEQFRSGEFNLETIVDRHLPEINDIVFVGIDNNTAFQEFAIEEIQKIIEKNTPDLLIIDNLDKIQAKGKTELEVSKAVSAGILQCARTTNTAIILIHHANKVPPDKKKTPDFFQVRGLSGFRGTNKIADDADIVAEIAGIHEKHLETASNPNLAKIVVYKDRNFRRKGSQTVEFAYGKFNDYDEPFPGLTETLVHLK